MIVTAFPRTAATHHCMRLAEQHGLEFADEPFQLSIGADPQSGLMSSIEQKQRIHEAYPTGVPEGNELDSAYVRAHMDEFVILSHTDVPELLEKTDLFVVRQDLNSIAESWIDLFSRANTPRSRSIYMFLTFGIKHIEGISRYLLDHDCNILLAESMYKFKPRENFVRHRLLAQDIVDEVYRKYQR
jgi:hypothetical protein